VPEAVGLAQTALAEAGDDPIDRARVLGRLAYLTMQLDLGRGVDLLDETVRLLERAAADRPVDPNLLANALLLRANGELGLVRPTRVAEIEQGLRLITDASRSWEKEGADGSAFGLARHTDDLDAAIAMTRDTIRSKSGPGGDDPFNVVMLSGLLLYRGEWPEARRRAEEAIDAYRREGEQVHPAWGLRGLALVAAHDGRLDDARRWAEEGARRAADRGDKVVTTFHHHILGFVELTRDRWSEADAHLADAAALAEETGIRHPGRFKLAGDLVEAALALGDIDRAGAAVARLDEAANGRPDALGAGRGRPLRRPGGGRPRRLRRGRRLLRAGPRRARAAADAVRAGADAAREGPPPSAAEGEAAGGRDVAGGAGDLRSAGSARLGRADASGAGPSRPPAAGAGVADRHERPGRRARRDRA
jgi:tetratricopeptide (TPR) repeat protein